MTASENHRIATQLTIYGAALDRLRLIARSGSSDGISVDALAKQIESEIEAVTEKLIAIGEAESDEAINELIR